MKIGMQSLNKPKRKRQRDKEDSLQADDFIV